MIVAVRHPKPALAEGICYGRLDVELDMPAPVGAEDLVGRLAQRRFDRVLSSPLRRAHEVAMEFAALIGAPLAIEPGLQEMNFGSWEGVAWADIDRTALDAWAADVTGYRPGDGETVAELHARVKQVWDTQRQRGGCQLWVTHAGPLRCLTALSRGVPLDQCLGLHFDYMAIVELGA